MLEHDLKYLTTYHFDNKLRLGNKGDGGYVIAKLPGDYDCYISAGVNDEESFSRDFINYYNMDLSQNYAFDGTINGYPYNYTNNIHFVKKNISGKNTSNTTNLKYLINKYDDIFLKMDIEGGEYPWLECLNENDLLKFKQIVIEYHCLNDDRFGCNYENKMKCLDKLANTHYIIHAHPNNNGVGWGVDREVNGIPNIIELTYIRKNCLENPVLNTTPFPIEGLDYKNAPYSDMSLTAPPFTFRAESN
jgi:hypothetical protein